MSFPYIELPEKQPKFIERTAEIRQERRRKKQRPGGSPRRPEQNLTQEEIKHVSNRIESVQQQQRFFE